MNNAYVKFDVNKSKNPVLEDPAAQGWVPVESSVLFWSPEEPGEELVGELVESYQGKYGVQHKVRKDDDSIVITPAHLALQHLLERVKIGLWVKIVYMGQQKSNTGRMYQAYNVFVKGGEGE